MLTKQQIFNKVAKHLLTQNKRAYSNGAALWDDSNGNICASACLIKPSIRKGLTNSDYWNSSWDYLKQSGVDMFQDNGDVFSLVVELTNCHDDNKPSRWPRKLRAIARKFKLKIPEYLINA